MKKEHKFLPERIENNFVFHFKGLSEKERLR